MNPLSRRDFVFVSSGVVAGNMLVGGMAEADDSHSQGLDFSHSGLVTGKPKPLKHKAIPGFLSAEQIAPHHTAHYGGALKGYAAADHRIEAAVKSGEPLDAAAYGSLKRAVSSKGNSVVLHEMYFDGLTPQAPDPADDVRPAIEKWSYVFCDYSVSGLDSARQGYTSYNKVLGDADHRIETTYIDDFTRASRDDLE